MNNNKKAGIDFFNSEGGELFLTYLESITLDKPVFNASVEAGKQVTHAAYREGQNDIVRLLKNLKV